MENKPPKKDEVYLAARALWESSVDISDRDIVEQLTSVYKEYAIKSAGTICKRRAKDARNGDPWVKETVIKSEKKPVPRRPRRPKTETAGNEGDQKRKQTATDLIPFPDETNKAQKDWKQPIREALSSELEAITDSIVIGAKEKNAIINKSRMRISRQGDLHDTVVKSAFDLITELENKNPDGDKIQKKLALLSVLNNVLEVTTRTAKTIIEVELPLSGILPDELRESEQSVRLGAMSKFGDIDEDQRLKRDSKKPALFERLRRLENMSDSDSFGRDEPDPNDGEISDVDFTNVDDD